MLPELAPEFPIRIGTIYPDILIDKSYKIDYVALSAASNIAVLVEFKTEGLSRRIEQDKYLIAAQKVGLSRLLEGLLDIFRATNAKRKYFCLIMHPSLLSKPIEVNGSGNPEHTYETGVVHTEYWRRIDIVCLDPESVQWSRIRTYMGSDVHIYELPILVGIELKYRKMGDVFGLSSCIADFEKLGRSIWALPSNDKSSGCYCTSTLVHLFLSVFHLAR